MDADGRFDARTLEPAEQVVRPTFLRALLLSKIGSKAIPETGLRTIGLVFEEELDLAYISRNGEPLPPLYLRQARLEKGASFDDASLSRLDLEGTVSKGEVRLQRAQVLGAVWLDGLDCQGGVSLMGATIGGQLSLDGAKLKGSADDQGRVVGPAVSADQATIKGGVFCSPADGQRFEAEGEVRLLGATIGGVLSLEGASLKGEVNAEGRVVGSALSADQATIEGGVFCKSINGQRFEAEGEVRLLGVTIGGQLSLNGAKLKGSADGQGHVVGSALSADEATIKGGIFCPPADGQRFEAEGGVRLLGATIGGQLGLNGAKLKGSSDDQGRVVGPALSAYQAEIKGSVFCLPADGHRFEAEGEVRLLGVTVGDLLNLSGAKLKGSVDDRGLVVGPALSADRATIMGGVFCRPIDGHRFEAEGEVLLLGTEIGGQLVLKGASFKGATDVQGRTTGAALSACGVKVADSMFLGEELSCDGEVDFSGAVLNDIYLSGSFRVADSDHDALNLSDATIRRLKVLALSGHGKVNLEGANADTFDGFFLERWGVAPTGRDGLELDLDGFTYRRAEFCTVRPKKRMRRWARLKAWDTDAIAENVLDLLDREFRQAAPGRGHYMPQPFEQAAKTLREAGYDRAANAVAVAKREFKGACRADGSFAAFLSGLSALFFRHGYGPLRATAWVIAFVVMGAWAFSAIDEGGGLVIADISRDNGAVVDSALPEGACRIRGGPPDLTGCAKATNELLAAGLNLAEQPIVAALDFTLGVPRPRPVRAAGTPAPRLCPEHPIAYSLDTLLPLVDFGIDKRCRVADDYPRRGLAETFRIAFAIFGWLFIPMVALTFTGVLRKD